MEEREKENLLFQHHVAASQQKQRKQHPSFAAIPKFFSSSATSGPSSSGSFPSLASSLASNHVSSLFWLESFSRHLESEVSTMLGYRRPLLVARSASASDIPYRDMEEEWRGTIREMEFELRSVCLPFLDELASAQSPPLEDKSLRINYETFQHLREESQHPFFQRLMTGRTFLKFSRDKYGRISTENLRRYLYNAHFKCVQMLDLSFFAHISALNSVTIAQQAQQEQLDKQQHQSPSHSPRAATPVHAGTLPVSPLNPATFAQKLLLSEDDIMKWIRSRLMHDTACPLLRPEHEDDFFGIYVFTSARRFLFFLDPKKRRQVSVQKLLESSLTAEFLDFAHLIHNTDWPDSPSLSGEGAGGGDDASSIGGDSSSAAERIDNPHSRHYVQHHSIIEDISEWAQSSRRFVSYFVGTRPAPLRHAPIPTSSGSSSSDHGLSGAHVGVNSSSNINSLPSQNQNKDLGTSSNGNGGGSSGGVGKDNFTPPIPPSLAASTSSAVASSNGEETASSAAAVNASSLDHPNPTHRGQPSTATGGALRDVVMMLFTPTLTPHREQVAATLRDAIVNSGVAIQQPPEPSPCVPSSSRVLSGPVPRIDTEHPGVASLEPKRVDWVLRPIVEESSSSSTGNDSASLKDDEVQSSDNVDEPFDRPHNSCLRVSLFQTNWFSADTPNSYYREYLELDRDENGMISKQELSLFRRQIMTPDGFVTGGVFGPVMRLTDAFLDRIFDEIVTFRKNGVNAGDRDDTSDNNAGEDPANDSKSGEGEMDYRLFVDFVLAVEFLGTTQGMQYFWNLLNLSGNGLDAATIGYFYKDIRTALQDMEYDTAEVADVVDEIFDMVAPADPTRITFDDICACKAGPTVISMLIDAEGFSAYDRRESQLNHDKDDDS